jgi:enoyl-CoA hydratase/carnithine racemase
MLPTYSTLLLEQQENDILLVTLNRPQAANAINTQMGRDFIDLWDRVNADPSRYRCVVITAAGQRAFCAGGDLKERNGMTDAQWQAQHLVYERMIQGFIACPIPLIAAVNGAAFGGGTEIALCTDFIYAANTARFALTEVTLGIMPGSGGTQMLPRAIGQRRAMELIMTGRPFSADDAFTWGLVNQVCEPDVLVEQAMATAKAIANNAPLATRQIKQSIRYGMDMDLRSGLMFEIEAYNRLVPTEDRLEGVLAFNEKRKPNFKGR